MRAAGLAGLAGRAGWIKGCIIDVVVGGEEGGGASRPGWAWIAWAGGQGDRDPGEWRFVDIQGHFIPGNPFVLSCGFCFRLLAPSAPLPLSTRASRRAP